MPEPLIRYVNPPTLPAPPGYSQVVIASATDLIVVAGQVALDPQGMLVGAGDFESQAEQVFKNLLAALQSAGVGPRHIVKLTTFVTDMSHLAAFRRVRDRYLDANHPPASTLVGVSQLFRPEFLLEVEALAAR